MSKFSSFCRNGMTRWRSTTSSSTCRKTRCRCRTRRRFGHSRRKMCSSSDSCFPSSPLFVLRNSFLRRAPSRMCYRTRKRRKTSKSSKSSSSKSRSSSSTVTWTARASSAFWASRHRSTSQIRRSTRQTCQPILITLSTRTNFFVRYSNSYSWCPFSVRRTPNSHNAFSTKRSTSSPTPANRSTVSGSRRIRARRSGWRSPHHNPTKSKPFSRTRNMRSTHCWRKVLFKLLVTYWSSSRRSCPPITSARTKAATCSTWRTRRSASRTKVLLSGSPLYASTTSIRSNNRKWW